MSNTENRYDATSQEVQGLLLGVHRSGERSFYRIDPDGQHYVVPIRKELMATLNICSKSATKLLKEACIPYAPFIRNEVQPPVEPEPDAQAMMIAAMEAAAKEAQREEKLAQES